MAVGKQCQLGTREKQSKTSLQLLATVFLVVSASQIWCILGPVYTIPDYFSYRINFHSDVKNKGVYTLPLRSVAMFLTVAMETSI